jgi:hypothetical protein
MAHPSLFFYPAASTWVEKGEKADFVLSGGGGEGVVVTGLFSSDGRDFNRFFGGMQGRFGG